MPQQKIASNTIPLTYKADSLKLKQANDSLRLKVSILEKSASDDRAIKYINAIGSNWPFLLILILTVLLIVCWKKIMRFSKTLTNVKGGLGPANIELIRESTPILIEEVNKGNKSLDVETSEKIDEDINTEESSEKEKIMFDVYLLLDKNKKEEAISLLEEIQNRETDGLKKDVNKIVFQFYKHLTGYNDSIAELNKIIEGSRDKEIKIKAKSYIARCLVFSQNYDKAIDIFLESLKEAKENNFTELISEIMIGMGDAFDKVGKWNEYIILLLEELTTASADDYKISIYKKAAEIYNKNNHVFESVAMLIKANDLVSNDINVLFDIAFRLSSLEFSEMSMQTYSLSNSIKTGQTNVINNLAVAYSDLGVKTKAIEFYKSAHALGSTLATSNLAFRYIAGGFINEAQEILDLAKLSSEVDPNVWKALDSINSLKKEEEDKNEGIRKRALLTKNFLIHYSDALIASKDVTINNSVFSPNGIFLVESQDFNVLKLEFEDSILTLKFSANGIYGTCVANYNSKPGKAHNSDSYSGYYAYTNGVLKVLLKYTYYHTRPEILLFELNGTFVPEG